MSLRKITIFTIFRFGLQTSKKHEKTSPKRSQTIRKRGLGPPLASRNAFQSLQDAPSWSQDAVMWEVSWGPSWLQTLCNPPFLILGLSWGPPGSILGSTWCLLGPSWAYLGPSWEHLGAILGLSWGHLGVILGPSCHDPSPVTAPQDSTLSVSKSKCLDPIGCGGLCFAVSIQKESGVRQFIPNSTCQAPAFGRMRRILPQVPRIPPGRAQKG